MPAPDPHSLGLTRKDGGGFTITAETTPPETGV